MNNELFEDMPNTLYILSNMATKNMIGSMSTNETMDGTNYDQWHLNDGDALEHLAVSMPTLSNEDEHSKDINASGQYQENIKA